MKVNPNPFLRRSGDDRQRMWTKFNKIFISMWNTPKEFPKPKSSGARLEIRETLWKHFNEKVSLFIYLSLSGESERFSPLRNRKFSREFSEFAYKINFSPVHERFAVCAMMKTMMREICAFRRPWKMRENSPKFQLTFLFFSFAVALYFYIREISCFA